MKRCPNCNRTYDEAGVMFCLEDGTELLLTGPDAEAPVTAVMSEAENDSPETISTPTPAVASPGSEIPATVAAPATKATGNLIPIMVIAGVLLMAGLVILVLSAVVPASPGLFPYFLARITRRLPLLLLTLGGISYAVLRWRSHPRASAITAGALAIFLADLVIYPLILYWLPTVTEPMKLSPAADRWFYSVVYFVEDIVAAVTIILLVAAVFVDRQPKTNIE